MANLNDEILKLINPTPEFKDPEANSDDETVAKVVDKDVTASDEAQQPSDLRRKAATYLVETDKRYAGKQTSRKKLDSDASSEQESDEDLSDAEYDAASKNALNKLGFGDVSEEEGEEDSEDSNVDEEEDEEEEEDIASFKSKLSQNRDSGFSFTDDGDYGKYGNDDDDESNDSGSDEEDDDEGSDEEDDEDADLLEDDQNEMEPGDGIQTFTSGETDESARGVAAKQQLGLWDSVLECRIQLQQVFSIVNQLPQPNTWAQFTDDQHFSDEASKSEELLKTLLAQLVHLQEQLLTQNSETKSLLEDTSDAKDKDNEKDDDDEEIPSDSEGEEEEEKPAAAETSNTSNVRKRKIKMDEYPDLLKRRNDRFMSYRNSTIQKWYDKTRLAGGRLKGKSFAAFDQSVLVQINQILGDKDRLIKRTQMKRSIYRVLGSNPEPEKPEDNDGTEAVSGAIKDYDDEIFDDDDFYHQLLRELIERKTASINDPVELSRQWLQIQKLRTKSRKNVDTKASKGRKLRYDVHKKLVNFMAPIDTCSWSHDARDDLFKSLFGKNSTAIS